ncbi:MAG: bifunctional diaminohydroxyphosphoribosylaminopyrimidine deaminase/5-amino-6-(5-phosphoribosylamino)uracil reductase RibD [Cellulosilyticum sp.]|nr:bifunctional diaminohydroxyphosphoribosylaminopyrimidine deaminase/5-amino-6-(5-phosphoribosylamino)uracil reductase RibD [Cellulosilyticum sp.]
MEDEKYMKYALELAKRGSGLVNPNPCVGAVIVKHHKILGEGWHKAYGGPHAEVNALASCTECVIGSTLYVTLEPCCHYGKTPPCVEAIIKSGIAKVVVGALDPNPLVAGKGIKRLRESGIEVVTQVLEKECMKVNEIFFHFITHKLPLVVMKYAMTLDGKIATVVGASQWITEDKAREDVHRDRNRLMGIMVGIETVLKDNPLLTCRIQGGRNPIRIICDTHLRIPLESKIVETASTINTILATCNNCPKEHKPFLEKGCNILVVPSKDGHIDLGILMQKLGEKGIDSILLEGGGTLNEAMLRAQLVHQIKAYIAPKLFGGVLAKSPIGGEGIRDIDACYGLNHIEITRMGNDILIQGKVDYSCLLES